jgi:tetratricopeptide (TPR) repeat protein
LEDAGDQLTTGVAWYLVRLAELHLECGHIDKAAAELERTVAKFPDYYLALAGLGKARAAQGRYSEAIDVFRRTIAVRPDPLFYMAKGDLHAKLGNVRAAKREYALAESSILESGATPAEYGRELSLFYSERNLKSARALELAQADLALRQDIFAFDTLAWALYRNARWQEGAEAIEKALRLGTRDARLHYHAGMIFHRLDRSREAREHLSLALSINPRFSILGADEARKTLASMKAARTTIGRATTGRTTTRRTSRRTCGACGKRS